MCDRSLGPNPAQIMYVFPTHRTYICTCIRTVAQVSAKISFVLRYSLRAPIHFVLETICGQIQYVKVQFVPDTVCARTILYIYQRKVCKIKLGLCICGFLPFVDKTECALFSG
jgi:hypothetical protein